MNRGGEETGEEINISIAENSFTVSVALRTGLSFVSAKY